MKLTCPQCDEAIDPKDVNMSGEKVFCRVCNEMFPLVDLTNDASREKPTRTLPADFDLHSPPAGAWYEAGFDGDTVGATCRGLGGAFFAFVFAAGFGVLPLALVLLGVESDEGEKLGGLMLIPFLLVGLGATVIFLLKTLGRSSARLANEELTLFTGVLGFGRGKTIPVAEVAGIGQTVCATQNGRPIYRLSIELTDEKTVGLGMFVAQKRLDYLEDALRFLFQERCKKQI